MGLDIGWYRGLVATDRQVDENDPDAYDYPKEVVFYKNDDFPGRADDIEEKRVYTVAEKGHFRAGSYSGYNSWRQWLCYRVAKQPNINAIWDGIVKDGPFIELINFSDCEGVFGSAVCAKLAKDFRDHYPAVKAESERVRLSDPYRYGTDHYLEIYEDFMNAFEKAADHGAVDFH